MIINGQSVPSFGNVPSYHVRPGERLVMTLSVTVPQRDSVTALWLGITTRLWRSGPTAIGGMRPVLARSRHPLSAGVHTFALRWRIPEHPSGGIFFLFSSWTNRHPPAAIAGPIIELALK